MADYKDSCFLSKAKEKRGNGPDYFGQVEISESLIRYLATRLKAGEEPKLRVALWRKENDRGVYLSMQLSEPREAKSQGNRPQRSRSNEQRNVARRDDPVTNDDPFDDEIPF